MGKLLELVQLQSTKNRDAINANLPWGCLCGIMLPRIQRNN